MNTDDEVLDEAGRRLDRISLVGLSATGYHGVFDHERREGQTFVADVVVHLDTRRAAAGDDLAQTLDYGDLAERIVAVLAGEPAHLIETVAERIAATVLARPMVRAVDVSVHKPQAPLSVPFADVVVTVRRDRSKLPAAEPWTPGDPVAHLGELAAHGIDAYDEAPAPAAPPDQPAPSRPGAAAEAGDRLDESPAVPVDVVVALGSNLGSSQATLRRAVAELGALPGFEVVAVSPLARTVAVGGPAQPDFLNAVVLGRTALAARALLHALQEVEALAGRERHEHWGPRTLDLDLIVYGSTTAVTDDLELPHPRAHQRAFVLQPWAEADPDAVLPGLGGGPVAALAATAPDREGVRWLALDWLTAGPDDLPAPTAPAVVKAVPEQVRASADDPDPGTSPTPVQQRVDAADGPGEQAGAAPAVAAPAAPAPAPAVEVAAPTVGAAASPAGAPIEAPASVDDEASPAAVPGSPDPTPEPSDGGTPSAPSGDEAASATFAEILAADPAAPESEGGRPSATPIAWPPREP